jgi:hypothetical protein
MAILLLMQLSLGMETVLNSPIVNLSLSISVEQTQSAERKNSNKAIDDLVRNLNLGSSDLQKITQIYEGLSLLSQNDVERILQQVKQMETETDDHKRDFVLQEIKLCKSQLIHDDKQQVVIIDENRDIFLKNCRKILKCLLPSSTIICTLCIVTATGYLISSWQQNK